MRQRAAVPRTLPALTSGIRHTSTFRFLHAVLEELLAARGAAPLRLPFFFFFDAKIRH